MSYFSKRNRGFSFSEMMVVIGIAAVLITIVVSKQDSFTDSLALSNLAEDISLLVVETKTYGVSVKELTPGSGNFNVSYGISFSLLADPDGSSTAYIYFADRDNDNEYDDDWTCPEGVSTDECLEKFEITGGNFVEEICIIRYRRSDICNNVGKVDISFARPSTEAVLRFFNNGGNPYNPSRIIGTRITLESPNEGNVEISIFNTGQVSIE